MVSYGLSTLPSKPRVPRSNRGERAEVRCVVGRSGSPEVGTVHGRVPNFPGPAKLNKGTGRLVLVALLGEAIRRRFEDRVRKTSGCWLWRGNLGASGYGRFKFVGGEAKAHRVSYELSVGPIPEGLVLDHLCRNTWCVNPRHLEPVTNRENTLRGIGAPAVNARKTHCNEGHPLSGDNLRIYVDSYGEHRRCLKCKRANAHGRKEAA